jgi:hypothetical protein
VNFEEPMSEKLHPNSETVRPVIHSSLQAGQKYDKKNPRGKKLVRKYHQGKEQGFTSVSGCRGNLSPGSLTRLKTTGVVCCLRSVVVTLAMQKPAIGICFNVQYLAVGIWEKTCVRHVGGGGSLFRIFFGESVISPLALPHLEYSLWAMPHLGAGVDSTSPEHWIVQNTSPRH